MINKEYCATVSEGINRTGILLFNAEKDIINSFKEHVLPYVIEHYEQDGIIDKPARCEAFNDYTDVLCKDGEISEYLYNTICIPDNLLY